MGKHSLIRSAGVVGSFTFLSRLLGLARDVLMAGFFGASLAMSSFVVAFTIPNLFRRLFGEGALSSAFVPVFVDSLRKDGEKSAWELAQRIVTLLAVVLLGILAVGLLLITLLMNRPDGVVAIGEAAGRPELSDTITRVLPLLYVMLPYMVFICLAALSMAILNAFKHFAVPAATPLFLNVIWILAVLFVCPRLGDSADAQIRGVAWAVLLAGVVQLGLQLPILWKFGYRPQLSFNWSDPRVKRVLQLMGPAALGLAVTQFNVLIDRLLAVWVGPDAPSALFYSERLIYFPLGIFATAMGTVLLPMMSRQVSDKAVDEAKETLNHSLRILLFMMIPAAGGLFILAQPIVQMIFEWRAFSPEDTDYTRIALQCYAPGLVVFSLAKIFVPAFYARQDTKTPVKVGVCTVLLNLVLNIIFVLTWPQPIKHAGLACATVISEGVYAICLAMILHRRMGSPGWRNIFASVLRSGVAMVIMVVVVQLAHPPLLNWALGLGVAGKIAQVVGVFGAIGLGVLVYAVTSTILKNQELRELLGALKNKKHSIG